MIDRVLSRHGLSCDEWRVHYDVSPAELVELAIKQGEGTLTLTGALAVDTGGYTGRAPRNRFIVDSPSVHDNIAWGAVNRPMDPERYQRVYEGACAYLSHGDAYVVRGLAGADRDHSRKFMVVCERASQALFARQMLVRPSLNEIVEYGEPDFTVLVAPGYRCPVAGTSDGAVVAIDLEGHTIVVAGTGYSGEIKKAIFSTMNYVLPVEDGVLSMHCSANKNPVNGETAVFFGLSGTGKTTLSADPTRLLIGDDEHGWSDNGVFNIEGGCYAKCIGLDESREPDIYRAVRFGAICENVVLNPHTRRPDYADASRTENTRCAYPVDHIANAVANGCGEEPSVVLFLAADAFGVLPPIARLEPEAAMYHFMTGFTSKVAGTEQGVVEPQPTFSALFGEPFMPLDPLVYANMLKERIDRNATRVYLVNTGWTGGGYGVGKRIDLPVTRALVHAALDGSLEHVSYRHDDRFNLDVPTSCPGVDVQLLDPQGTWDDPAAYDRAARKLASMFEQNFAERYPHAPAAVREAGPRA